MANALSYIKNVGKSVSYATVDVIKEMSPVFSDLAETNGDLTKDMYKSIKNLKTTIIDTIKALRCTPVRGKDARVEYRRKKALKKRAYTVAAVVMIVTLLTCGMLIAFASNVSERVPI